MRNVTWKDIASASGQRQQQSGVQATELYEKLFCVLLTYGTEQQQFSNFCFISLQHTTNINKRNSSSRYSNNNKKNLFALVFHHVTLSLCLIKNHIMKTYGGNGGVAANLDSRWRWLWTITLLPFYPHGQRPQYVVFNKKYL
jgi:hypothetical protein